MFRVMYEMRVQNEVIKKFAETRKNRLNQVSIKVHIYWRPS